MVVKKLLLAAALCAATIGTVSAENWVAYSDAATKDGLPVLHLYETESLEYSAEDKVHSVWTAIVPHHELDNGIDIVLFRVELRCGKQQMRPTNTICYAKGKIAQRSDDAGKWSVVIPNSPSNRLYHAVCKNKKLSYEAGRFEKLNKENRKRIQQYLAKKYDLPLP